MVDSPNIALAASNFAPSDLKNHATEIAENTSDLTVGIFSATEECPRSIANLIVAIRKWIIMMAHKA